MDRFEQPLRELERLHAELVAPSKAEAAAAMTPDEVRAYEESSEKLAEWKKIGAELARILESFISDGGAQLARALHELAPPGYAGSLAAFGVTENARDGVVRDIHGSIIKLAEGLRGYYENGSTRDGAAATERVVPVYEAVELLKRTSVAAQDKLKNGGLVDIEMARKLCLQTEALGSLSQQLARAALAMRDIHSAIYECYNLATSAVVRAESEASSKQSVDDLQRLLEKRRSMAVPTAAGQGPAAHLPKDTPVGGGAGALETQGSTQDLTQPTPVFAVPATETERRARGRALGDALVPHDVTEGKL